MTAMQGLGALIIVSVIAFAGMIFFAVEQIDKERE
jgi:hypothetical protein